jgi:TonB family protein
MGMRFILVMLILGYLRLFCQAQSLPIAYDTLSTIPSFRYQGGGGQFFERLMSEVSYPPEAFSANRQGIALISFTVDPKGQVADFHILNSLHPAIDREITKAFDQTRPGWKSFATEVHMVFVLPILFRSVHAHFEYEPIPWFCLNSMLVTIDRPMPEAMSDADLRQQLRGASQSPLPLLDELIRRDPFHAPYRQLRARYVKGYVPEADPCADVYFLRYLTRQQVPADLSAICP